MLLTVVLAVFLGCHAYVAFMVLPAAYTDWQKSDLTQIGDQDRRTDECCLYLICDRTPACADHRLIPASLGAPTARKEGGPERIRTVD